MIHNFLIQLFNITIPKGKGLKTYYKHVIYLTAVLAGHETAISFNPL